MSAEQRFNRLYAEHGRAVLAYAAARTEIREDAADVVAETFLVAWRRAEDVPAGDEARFWLYAVARGALANQRRGERRRSLLAARLRSELAVALGSFPAPDAEALGLREAMAKLEDGEREVLLLSAHEGLRSKEIGKVLGITAGAARIRLHRARRRLRAELATGASAQWTVGSTELEMEEA